MDITFEEFYTSTRKEVCCNGFPPDMFPILEMIAAISVCNKEMCAGITKSMTSEQYSLFKKEKLEKIKSVLCANSENVNAVDDQTDSCLHFAVRRSDCDSDVVRELLNHGADPNKVNKKGDSPLHSTARMSSSSEIMRILLKHGGNVNIQNCNGDTPLHVAARKLNNLTTAEVLLDNGARAEITNFALRNVMHATLEGKNCDPSFVITCLNRYPQLVNSRDIRNVTPLHLAVLDCEIKVNIIQELLKRGADVNARDIAGRTPMHWIQYNSEDGDFHIVKAFMERGADINARDVIDRTPLFYAVRTRSYVVIKQLIRRGADVNTFDLMYKSILNEAVNGFELGEKVKCLQEQDAALIKQEMIKNFHSTQLFRPLVNSVFRHSTLIQLMDMKTAGGRIEINSQKQIEIIKLLLENGADPDFGNLEYRIIPFSINVPCADKLVLQYRVLKNFKKVLTEEAKSSESFEKAIQAITTFDIELFQTEFRDEWLNFRDKCIFEINKMRLQKFSNGVSLYEFVAQRCSTATDFALSKFEFVDEFLLFLNRNEYTYCKDIIYNSIKRKDLKRRVLQFKIFTFKDDKTRDPRLVVLDLHTIGYIVRYLSKKDLIQFILACISESKSTQDSLSCNKRLTKRRAEVTSNEDVDTKQQKVL